VIIVRIQNNVKVERQSPNFLTKLAIYQLLVLTGEDLFQGQI